jgi:AcrR family transcriptional regulator
MYDQYTQYWYIERAMSPRPYRSSARESAAAETRRRIIAAARTVLSAESTVTFTVDRIAEIADVARMTIYNQFGSKRGLVEALSDDLAAGGGIGRLPQAFRATDAMAGLEIVIEVFTGFWERERLVLRRLRAVIALDPELSQYNRDARRRQALTTVIRRLSDRTGSPAPDEVETAADLLLVLTSFEAYEDLAAGRDHATVVRIVNDAAKRVLGGESNAQRSRGPDTGLKKDVAGVEPGRSG